MPTKALPPTPFRLLLGDDDFAEAWEYLPSDAKKALAAALPKLPSEDIGAQLRQRIRNAVVVAGVLFKYGSHAYEYKHGQVDLFTGSGASRKRPSKLAMHIAKRLMGSDEKSLRTSLKRLEQVVYAYSANGHTKLPSDRLLDDTIQWAFAIRVRKPRPFLGASLILSRRSDVPVMPWSAVERAFKACSLWPEGSDVPWYEWCWKLLTEAGLTEYRNAEERDLVRLRAVALQFIYWDYCIIVFNRMRTLTGEKLYVALGGSRLGWHRQAALAQRADVAGVILGHYKRLDDSLRRKGRLQFEGGASHALLDDLQASLPLLGDTLKAHFQNPASTATGPGTSGGKSGPATYERKIGYLHSWVVAGMVVMPVRTGMTKGTPDKTA
ncbi:MAG: hypothetical protein IPM46_09850 [Flavobacteriales bacterium]|nr:hypothetical protein [Flavobacteriales bacterium]